MSYAPHQPSGARWWKRKGKPWVWALAGTGTLFALVLAGGAAADGGGSAGGSGGGSAGSVGSAAGRIVLTPSLSRSPVEEKAATTAGLGDRVADGTFEFIVQRVECSRTYVGSEFLHKTAQGQFCLVRISVKNVGKTARLFSGANLKAFDAAGTAYANDGAAEFYTNENNDAFLTDIRPGRAVTGKVVFDVPASVRLERLELHDSPSSRGVMVSLA